jgi:hypothetical protein
MTNPPDANTPEAPQKATGGRLSASEGASGQRETLRGQNGPQTGAEGFQGERGAGEDPRQPAYDAVYAYIRELGDYMPPDPVHRNVVIWRGVHAALDAVDVPPLQPPAHNAGPSIRECAEADARWWGGEKAGE